MLENAIHRKNKGVIFGTLSKNNYNDDNGCQKFPWKGILLNCLLPIKQKRIK